MFKKFGSKTLITLFIFSTVLSMGILSLPQATSAQAGAAEVTSFIGAQASAASSGINVPSFWLDQVFEPFFAWIATTVLQIVSLFTGLAGVLLNGIVYLTVVKVTDNYSNISAINVTWGVVRDVANMSFIFILLYAAIKTILGMGGNAQSIVVRVVVVAVLINFSLFFTKVVIDTSNVLALFFYDSIAPSSLNAAFDISSFESVLKQRGLSNAFMQHMNVTSLYQTVGGESIDSGSIVTIGVLGSVMLLIAAFIFAAVAIMFIIRYVVLIFVLILSPIAFLGFVLPGASGLQKKWLDALIRQAFFAPVYFFMTWITLNILAGIMKANVFLPPGVQKAQLDQAALGSLSTITQTQTIDTGVFGMIINFIVVITFLIASLVISKKWADGAGNGMNKATAWAMGKAGAATFGTVGGFGRNVIGSRATAMAANENLKDRASRGGFGGGLARLQLATARKGAASSFDLRASSIGSSLGAGQAKKGGFAQDQKDRAKKYEAYKPDQNKIKAAEADAKLAKAKLEEARKIAISEADKKITKHPELEQAEQKLQEARNRAANTSYPSGVSQATIDNLKAQRDSEVKEVERLVNEEKSKREEAKSIFVTEATKEERLNYRSAQAKRAELKVRMERMAKRTESGWMSKVRIPGFMASGKIKAEAIRSATKSKSAKDSFIEAAKKMADEESAPKEEKPAAPADSEAKPKE